MAGSAGPSGAVALALSKDGVALKVKACPRASKSRVEGAFDGALKVHLAAPPVDGAANEELVLALADFFHVPKSAVTIASGGSSRIKRVLIRKITLEEAARALASLK